MRNVFSVDVEDYHDQLALDFQERIVPPDSEAERCTNHLLDLCAEYGVKGTFFMLGEIAEYFPEMVKRIGREGHQLGVHQYYHYQVFRQTPAQFRESIGSAKKRIEDLTGRAVESYRAVAFSIGSKTMWAFDILVDLGFQYDSSIFPIRGRRYGIPTAPRFPYIHRLPDQRTIYEVPMSTYVRNGRRWPACGGGYLRLFPMRYTDAAFRQINAENQAAVIYMHPYELEPKPQVRQLENLTFKQWLHFKFFNFHQKVGRRKTELKLRHLFKTYRFGTIEQVISELASENRLPTIDQEDMLPAGV